MWTSIVAILVAASSIASPAAADLVLNEKIWKLTQVSAELSALAYDEPPVPAEDYDIFQIFTEEPDQALVVQHEGYCYAAFRGTTLTREDWRQNFKFGTREVCAPAAAIDECCSTRTGFYQAYNTKYSSRLELALRKCAKSCSNKNECVVLTGHSQVSLCRSTCTGLSASPRSHVC